MPSSVIAKMQITSCRDFGKTGFLTVLNCVCENDLMAAYADSEEDRMFTKYSPWGEMQLGKCLVYGVSVDMIRGHKFYVIALRGAEKPTCPGATAVIAARCSEVAKLGPERYRVEVGQFRGEEGLNWRMSIDNPPAVAFFEPDQCDYWVAFYDASQFTRDTALGDAHTDA
jgi:hypothetical protein